MNHYPGWKIFVPALLLDLFISSSASSALPELKDENICRGKIILEGKETITLMTDAGKTIPAEKSKTRRVAPSGNSTEFSRKKLEEQDIPFDSEEFIRRIQEGDREIVSRFLFAGMSPNTSDKNGNPALLRAVRSRNLEITRVLVCKAPQTNAGTKPPLLKVVDINAANKDGETPLLAAVKDDQVDIAEFLLKEGADVNARSTGRESALMLAAKAGNIEMVKLLLKEGADVNARTADGETALTMATEEKQRKVVEFLTAHSPDAGFKARQREWIRSEKERFPSKIYIPLSWMDMQKDEFITERFNESIERPGFYLTGYRETGVKWNMETTNKWVEFRNSKKVPAYTIKTSMIIDNTQRFSCINEVVKKELGSQIELSYSEGVFSSLAAVLGEHKLEEISLIFHGPRYGGIDSIAYMDFAEEGPSVVLNKPFILDKFVTCWEYYIENKLALRLDEILNADGLCEHLNNCRPDPSIGIRFGQNFLDKIPHEIDEEHRVLVLW